MPRLNAEENRRKASEWYANNKKRVSSRNKDRRNGENGDAFRAKNAGYSRDYRARIKAEAIAHYGGFCVDCGETLLEILCLDHINDDGAQHRREVTKRAGYFTYEWAKKNNWPGGIFAVRCCNCNHKKEFAAHGVSGAAVRNRRLKLEAIQVYGKDGGCSCCTEKDPDVLQLDHIGGGGNQHRSAFSMKGGSATTRWAKKNDWPPVFRVLCANCNHSAHIGGGVCIHTRNEHLH